MKVESRKVSAKEWRNLTRETQELVDDALVHLNKLEAIHPKERREIVRWKNVLGKHSVTIDKISSGYSREIFAKSEPREDDFIVVKDRVQLSKQQVRGLPKQNFAEARSVLNTLHSNLKLFAAAGPHGAGGGKPKSSKQGSSEVSRGWEGEKIRGPRGGRSGGGNL
jgi:hypothetical protein